MGYPFSTHDAGSKTIRLARQTIATLWNITDNPQLTYPMHANKFYSAFLVFAQFLVIALIFSPLAALWPLSSGWEVVGVVLFFDAIALAVWSLSCMRLQSFSVMPEPRATAQLTTHGPYRFIRHPMYSAVLMACLGACVIHAVATKVLLLIVLAGVLLLKIHREEALLSSQYSEYDAYRRHTKALIPFIV